jgi:hypothetical protein
MPGSSEPASPAVAALPPASAANRGKQVVLKGNGTSTPDRHYVCLLSAAGSYNWKELKEG